jgi:glutamate-ammonia-ligase adenylyltransferase
MMNQVAAREYERLVVRYGEPTIGDGPRAGQPCEGIILALGKQGGREPNYHSDLDIVFIYEAEGQTCHRRPNKRDGTTNQHFFSQWGQRIIKSMTYLGPYGRLYEIDPRLRPTGKSGTLAVSLPELARYHREGHAQLWERQTLCKARPVFGSIDVREQTMRVVHDAMITPVWLPGHAQEIRDMRRRMEDTAKKANLKRGRGGTVDIEFLTQMLQLRHAFDTPSVLVPGTLAALGMLHEAKHLADDDFQFLSQSYRFLRSIEARLRLMNTTARHDLPDDPRELAKLAYLLDYPNGQLVHDRCRDYMAKNREVFNRIFDTAARG